MSELDALEFANEAFYLAFRNGDLAAMDAVWATDTLIMCIHPGWNPLFDRPSVMASWQRILQSKTRPRIECLDPVPHIIRDIGVVVCFEQIDSDFLVATNMYVRDKSLWRLFHHQSGPAAAPPDLSQTDNQGPMN